MKITKLSLKQRILTIILGGVIAGILPTLELIDGYIPFGFREWYTATFDNWGMFILTINFAIGVSIKTIITAIMKVAFGETYDRQLDTFNVTTTINKHVLAMKKLYDKESKHELLTISERQSLLRKIVNYYTNKHSDFFSIIYSKPEYNKINGFENIIALVEARIK